MKRSESISELAKALSVFQGSMRSVPKKQSNPHLNSNYADLDAIWDVVREPLKESGFSLVQTTDSDPDGNLFLETTLLHTSGEYLSSTYPITPMRQVKDVGFEASGDPQSLGSAITYARRYAMSAMLGISAEDDDDAEGAMNREGKAPVQRTRQANPALDPNSEYFCKECKVMWAKKTKDGKTWYSHKKEDGSWCNMPDKADAARARQTVETGIQEAQEPPPDDQEDASGRLIGVGDARAALGLETQPFENLGALYTAAANGKGLRGGLSQQAVITAAGYDTAKALLEAWRADNITLEEIWAKVMETHGAR